MVNSFRCTTCGELAPGPGVICRYCGNKVDIMIPTADALSVGNVPRSLNETEKTLMASAKLMDKTALYKTGMLFAEGIGIEKNLEVAEYLLREGALKGCSEAMFRYAELIKEKQPEEANVWLSRAAKCGCPEAKNIISDHYKEDFGNPQEQFLVPEVQEDFRDVVGRVSPFCVELTSSSSSSSAASGSGCIVGSDAIITNAHVVIEEKTGEPHKTIMLDFYKGVHAGRRALKVVAFDKKEDVALCAFVDAKTGAASGFPKLADARTLAVGDRVFTIGNALGRGLALSTGVVAKEVETGAYGKAEVLQTDMSINGGNSGGPLFDSRGNIVGMMTFSPVTDNAARAYGMSFAVTSNTIARLLKKWTE